MATLLHLARWIAWQISDHDASHSHPPARITVLSADGVEDF
jgi:hypothetical protein